MNPQPKVSPFRSQKLRDLAREAPHCMYCGRPNQDDVVACHSNRLADGKGLGLKASDACAYLCPKCHDKVDGREPGYSEEFREALFCYGAFKTWKWLLESGHLKVVA